MSQIPVTSEYAAAVGSWCEKVENRSLLLDKFAFPKKWGDAVKENQASAWSLMRIASNGSILLQQKARQLGNPGRNVQPDKAEAMRASAKVCTALANTQTGSGLELHRPEHTSRFLEILQNTYGADRLVIVTARLEGRLAINLAEGIIQNAGISLDRLFGTPLIPGSAIKGVARDAAFADSDNRNLAEIVFGKDDSSCQGAIAFLPASPVNQAKIVVDITNVHTPDYYRTGCLQDLSKENPKPNPFPAVERGAEFAFPIVLLNPHVENPANLLAKAKQWLIEALTVHGLGAKTAAGYGWFTDAAKEREDAEAQARAEQERIEQAAAKKAAAEKQAADDFDALPLDDKIGKAKTEFAALDDQNFAKKVKDIATLLEYEQRAIICLFREDKAKREKLKTWRKKKPENAKFIEETAKKLREQLS